MLMTSYQESNIRFSAGPAAANMYYTINDVQYRLCFDWSYDYLYFKVDSNRDIEVNLIDFKGIELIDSTTMQIFLTMCEQMISKTQNHDYKRVNENRARIIMLCDKIKEKIV